MKRLFISLVIVGLSFSAFLSAQDRPEKGKGNNSMLKELNLTTDQAEKMKSEGEDFHSKMKELRDNKNLSKEDKQAKMKELTDQHQESISKILTPEQQAK
ncbi:MAG: hypothetical protein LBV43_00445, partial [Prevotella sp.]|nr:hypothetical protein [Prevotella sp.]